MDKKFNLIFDFDSTFIKLETIEVLANFSLEKNPNRISIAKQVKKMTALAMTGKLLFSSALLQRISLLELNEKHIYKTIEFLKTQISTSIKNSLSFFKKNRKNCYIVSGGFKEIIIPIVRDFNFIEDNIYANSFIYDNDSISVNINNPLSKDNGKVLVAKNIKGNNIIIGDGYTDYEVKKYGQANIFIQYIENINRKELNNKADFISSDFKKIIKFISDVQ